MRLEELFERWQRGRLSHSFLLSTISRMMNPKVRPARICSTLFLLLPLRL